MTTGLVRTLAIGWTVLCIALGLATAWTVGQLREASDAIDRAGSALTTTGEALAGFDRVPFVGDEIGATGSRISDQGDRTSQIADDTRTRILVTAIVAGLLVALLGSAPVLLLWRVVEGFERRIHALEAGSHV